MQNEQQILIYSFIIFLFITVAAVFNPLISAYGATLGSGKFRYRFEKKRLPMATGIIGLLLVLSFSYSFVATRELALAAQFCAAITFFGAIGSIINVCFVRK